MKDFIEQIIINAIKALLKGRVNELLREYSLNIPLIELGNDGCMYGMVPEISLSLCERTVKERIIRLDAYSLSITFTVPESHESEEQCYAIREAVCQAIYEAPTLSGIVDRAAVTGDKSTPPKKPGCGEGWVVAISLRLTVDGRYA